MSVNVTSASCNCYLRAASDRRIELDKQKRDAIEQHKQRELDAQRAHLASWQDTVGTHGMLSCTGCSSPAQTQTNSELMRCTDQAESDYEDEDVDELPTTSKEDHTDYHGRGWRRKKAKAVGQKGTSSDGVMHQEEADMQGIQESDDQQAIWGAPATSCSPQRAAESEQSSGTVVHHEDSATSR